MLVSSSLTNILIEAIFQTNANRDTNATVFLFSNSFSAVYFYHSVTNIFNPIKKINPLNLYNKCFRSYKNLNTLKITFENFLEKFQSIFRNYAKHNKEN